MALLALAPYGYTLALVLLHLASAPSALAWVQPGLDLIEAVLPLVAAIRDGHEAAGHPVYGMVNAHLLAVGHLSGLTICVVILAFGLRNTATMLRMFRENLAHVPRRSVWLMRWPLPLLALLCLSFGLAMLLYLVLGFEPLRLDGSFKGGRNVARLPGMVLILFAQFAWLTVALATVLAGVWINHGRDAMSGPEAGPPAQA